MLIFGPAPSELMVRTYPGLGAPGTSPQTVGSIPVPLAALAWINAMGLRRPNPVGLRVLSAEIDILLSHLVLDPGRPVRLRPDFKSTASHLERFVSESFGLLACTAVVAFHRGTTPTQLVQLDNAARRGHFLTPGGWRGNRPDLAFFEPGTGWIAGEARGRSGVRAPLTLRAEQVRRNRELRRWAWHVYLTSNPRVRPKWFASWVWLNDKAGVVDVIDPGQPTMFIPDDSSTGYVHEIEDRLWEDDIPVLGLIADVRVKAVWVSPSLGEEPPQPIHFLAGILEHDLRTRQDVVRRLPARIRQGEVEVDVHGRIVGMLVRGTRPTGDDLRQFFGTLEESLNERPEPT